MVHWCTDWGVTHQFTAPHTFAQNSCIKCLHRTLMNKAWAMQLSCNAPLHMWDEFILTTSYLSTLITSKVARGCTPYKLWFGTCPSLSHLCKIGCQAYVLVHGNNLKIAAKSVECILVSYVSNAKAYCCWHQESWWIVDSYHVTFDEHLNDHPQMSLPGTDAIVVPCVFSNQDISNGLQVVCECCPCSVLLLRLPGLVVHHCQTG